MHNINKNIGRIALVFIPYVILVLFATFGLRFCETKVTATAIKTERKESDYGRNEIEF